MRAMSPKPAETHASSPAAQPESAPAPREPAVRVKTHLRAGTRVQNHTVQVPAPPAALRVKTKIRAGGRMQNHGTTVRGGSGVRSA
jgi:hypothetical protein